MPDREPWLLRCGGRDLELHDGHVVTIGAHGSCDVVLAGDRWASDVQARVWRTGDEVVIERVAAGSVRVSGAPVVTSVRTRRGCALEVGSTALELVRPRRAGRKPVKVLLLDDNPIALELMAATLRDGGYEVVTRSHPLGTAQEILRHRPHVLLVDVNMPALSGPSVARFLHDQTITSIATLRIVFVSAMERAALDALVAEHAVAGGLVKTGDHAAFLAAFEVILAREGLAPAPRGA